jgi:ATP-dependent DNA helicase RecQ
VSISPKGSSVVHAVYCFSQKQAEDVAQLLNRAGVRSGVYHAGVDAQVKDRVLRQWSNDQLQVVVATIAFGLG